MELAHQDAMPAEVLKRFLHVNDDVLTVRHVPVFAGLRAMERIFELTIPTKPPLVAIILEETSWNLFGNVLQTLLKALETRRCHAKMLQRDRAKTAFLAAMALRVVQPLQREASRTK